MSIYNYIYFYNIDSILNWYSIHLKRSSCACVIFFVILFLNRLMAFFIKVIDLECCRRFFNSVTPLIFKRLPLSQWYAWVSAFLAIFIKFERTCAHLLHLHCGISPIWVRVLHFIFVCGLWVPTLIVVQWFLSAASPILIAHLVLTAYNWIGKYRLVHSEGRHWYLHVLILLYLPRIMQIISWHLQGLKIWCTVHRHMTTFNLLPIVLWTMDVLMSLFYLMLKEWRPSQCNSTICTLLARIHR